MGCFLAVGGFFVASCVDFLIFGWWFEWELVCLSAVVCLWCSLSVVSRCSRFVALCSLFRLYCYGGLV